jgi:DNA polymerase (family 10)
VPVHNAEVADIFDQVADLLEIEGANEFRVRAYREAAATIGGLTRSVDDMVGEGADLTELDGIGDDLADKIKEIVNTGRLEQLEEIEARTPPELADLLNVSGLGPKRVARLHHELGVTTRADLEKAARGEQIRELHGFGPRIEHDILEDLERSGGEEKRMLLMKAEQIARPLVSYLEKSGIMRQITIAGSYRRRRGTVGDLDLVAVSESGEEAIDHFVDYEDVEEVISRGETRSTVVLRPGMQVDLRVVSPGSFGAALFYLTGSRSHNLTLREMALDRDLKINEYGVFDGEERIAGGSEAELYGIFDLAYIPPELREDRGEFGAAAEDRLPDLVTLDAIRGDLQTHTDASDGVVSLEAMVEAARARDYDYLAITDHSEHIGITQGLDAERLARQIDEIERLNERYDGFRVLKGVEVDILEDGALALPDGVLERLDLRVCAVHSHLDLSREKQTERILRAMDNPHFNILAHPTGRRIGERRPYDLDMERVMEAAVERGCYLEVNASPDRLDLKDRHCRMARERGLKVSIATDAHRASHLDYIRYGVDQARRGWLRAEDVLNTRKWDDLKEWLERG